MVTFGQAYIMINRILILIFILKGFICFGQDSLPYNVELIDGNGQPHLLGKHTANYYLGIGTDTNYVGWYPIASVTGDSGIAPGIGIIIVKGIPRIIKVDSLRFATLIALHDTANTLMRRKDTNTQKNPITYQYFNSHALFPLDSNTTGGTIKGNYATPFFVYTQIHDSTQGYVQRKDSNVQKGYVTPKFLAIQINDSTVNYVQRKDSNVQKGYVTPKYLSIIINDSTLNYVQRKDSNVQKGYITLKKLMTGIHDSTVNYVQKIDSNIQKGYVTPKFLSVQINDSTAGYLQRKDSNVNKFYGTPTYIRTQINDSALNQLYRVDSNQNKYYATPTYVRARIHDSVQNYPQRKDSNIYKYYTTPTYVTAQIHDSLPNYVQRKDSNVEKGYITLKYLLTQGYGTGTVTSVSSGNLSPLFTSSVATSTTTPAITYTATAQLPRKFYVSGTTNNGTIAPSFRTLFTSDLPAAVDSSITLTVPTNLFNSSSLSFSKSSNVATGTLTAANESVRNFYVGGTTHQSSAAPAWRLLFTSDLPAEVDSSITLTVPTALFSSSSLSLTKTTNVATGTLSAATEAKQLFYAGGTVNQSTAAPTWRKIFGTDLPTTFDTALHAGTGITVTGTQSVTIAVTTPNWAAKTFTTSPTYTSTTTQALGLAYAFTPTQSGYVELIITGNVTNATAADGTQWQICYGTGSAPLAHATSGLGTTAGSLYKQTANIAGSDNQSFTAIALVSGLTINTAYWLDLQGASITGATSTFSSVTTIIKEAP